MDRLVRLRANCLEWTLDGLSRLAARRGRRRETATHLATGIEGEDAAYLCLAGKGYQVVARRWSAGNIPGDLDLIAWNGPLLCFVEVKARTAHDASPAEAAIDAHKRATLRRLASRYLSQLPRETPPETRFDVISVYLLGGQKDCVHFEDAFGWSERRHGRE